jgi:hypothetical protein
VALAAAAAAPVAWAAEPLWYLQVDNDVPFHTDRWYTSGVRIARVHDGIEWGVLQEIYTPEAKRWQPGIADRAPAGRLLLSLAKHDVTPAAFQTLEVMAGVRGPSAGGRGAADAIHQVVPAPFVDWSRELPDEFDATLVASRTQQAWGPLKLHFGAQLGTQLVFAHAGLEARWGGAPGSASRLLRFAATPGFTSAGAWSAYAGVSLRGVGRNELLSANYDAGGPGLARESMVTRFAAGVAWSGTWGAVTFDLAQDSREFGQQRTPHRFGSLAVHVAF